MLFEEQIARKPNLYPWTQEYIEKMWFGFWTPDEFDFKSDFHQFKTEMPENKKRMLVKALSAIGQVEIAVKRFWANLGTNLPHPSMYDLGFVLANTEVIHNQAYEKLLETLRLTRVFEENLKVPVVGNRVAYLRKHLDKVYTEDQRKQYIYSIILFTLFVENVSLFSQFYIILWLNRFDNVLKDTAQQVQYTRNEEQIHALVGVKIINTLREEYPELFDEELEQKIQDEAITAYKAERDIIEWMMEDVNETGLNSSLLTTFIEDRINSSLEMIGFKTVFAIDHDELEEAAWFDEELFGKNKTDFFHKQPTDYAKKNKPINKASIFRKKEEIK
jgi:ribonucleoside-diphosphate reductase beta chain